MENYQTVLLEIMLPVLLMFGAERLAVSHYLSRERYCVAVRANKWLHPNSISIYRFPMGFLSALILHLGYPKLAILFFSFWMITDLTDGDIARRCDLHTPRGETLDPLSDKFMYTPLLIYFAYLGWVSTAAVIAFIAADAVGQGSRFFIERKGANLFGKAKTFMVVVLLGMVAVEHVYGPLPHARMVGPVMALCVGLAVASTAFKVIPNYWYANILSLMNLVCGLAGIAVILLGHPPIYAFGLVFLGQFLDLFDGRAAEKWGSTPSGEIFDDVADGTNFGLTVALIIAVSFQNNILGAILGLGHASATIYRLIRFVVEKRKAGIQGGVKHFSGMPSPAGALMAGATCLFITVEPLKAAIVALETVLMVSRLPYHHFGRTLLPKIPKIIKVAALAAYMFMLAHAVRTEYYDAVLGVVFLLCFVYVMSPVTALFKKHDGGNPGNGV